MGFGRSHSRLAIYLTVCSLIMGEALRVSAWTASCGDPSYKHCYAVVHKCPPGCPKACEMDCNLCKPICPCDKPGAVCQDPRFIGGDGIMFYFHGKRDSDFCLVSDNNIHINAHFIGKSREGRTRDFTWVQSIFVFFGSHKLYVGAKAVATWDNAVDQLNVIFDETPVLLPVGKGSSWEHAASLKITRIENANAVTLEVEGNFKITARVVPITAEESRVHNYGITPDDCFAHLEINFKFYGLTPKVTGVLGQTYSAGFRSPVKIGAAMPIMGGESNYATSSLASPDCAVARFGRPLPQLIEEQVLASINCGVSSAGRGMVCRR